MDRRVVSKLLEADPEFASFLATLHGVSKLHDPSEVHVKGDRKKERRLATGALAGTGIASVGGAHALYLTGKEAHGLKGDYEGRHIAPEMPKFPKIAGAVKRLPVKPKTLAAAGVAGWAALHTTELAADALNARAQVKTIQANPKPKKSKVQKGVIGHFQPAGLVRSNARARKLGLRPTALTTPVHKGMFTKVGEEFLSTGARARQAHPIPTGRHRPKGPSNEAQGRHRGEIPTRKLSTQGKFVAVGAPTVAGLTGAAAVTTRPKDEVVKAAWTATISKVDVEKRQVFGWASLSMVDGQPVVDRQGDYVPIEETEDSAYHYMLHSRMGGDMHARVSKLDGGPRHTADVIESIVFTPEKLEALGLEPDAVPLGWWIGMQIHDEENWQDIKDGKRTGFSVHGSGTRREMVAA